jgi:hypothetical protein
MLEPMKEDVGEAVVTGEKRAIGKEDSISKRFQVCQEAA